jgi:hypothetical protein
MPNTIIGEKREGSTKIRSSRGLATLEETYEFLVRSDNKNNSRINILGTPGLPRVNRTASAFGFTICKSLDAKRDTKNPLIWHVTASFSSEVEENQSGPNSSDPQADPVEWVPVYETKFERLQEVVTKDRDGDSVANSAGQPFETGLTISRFIPVWEFYQFEPASVDDETIIDRNETINSASFKGKPAKTLLLSIVSSVVGLYYGAPRRLTQYAIRYNSREWTHKRLDVGTVYLDGSVHKPYTDNEGNVILGALDGSGAKQTPGTAPATLEFDIYPEISFSFLRS